MVMGSTWMEERHMATSTPVQATAGEVTAADPGVVIAPIPGWALAALFEVVNEMEGAGPGAEPSSMEIR